MNLPKLYPLLLGPGTSGPKTKEEKAAYDAGMEGLSNPHPDNDRCVLCYNHAVDMKEEVEWERNFVRKNGHKF